MKILVMFASGLGDALFVGPAIFAIKELFHGAEISVLVPRLKFNRYVLENVLPIDRIFVLERPKLCSPVSVISYISNFIKLAKVIRKEKFDKVIATVQARLPDQYLLMLLSGAQHRIGPNLWRRKNNAYRFLLTDRFGPGLNEHIYYDHFDILSALGQQASIDRYVIMVRDALVAKAADFTFTRKSDRLVVVLPGSGSQAYKRWDNMNFIKVIKHIIRKHHCDVAVIGGGGEYDEKLMSDHLAQNRFFHDLNGKLTVAQIIWLLRQANLVIANDNGLLHLAEFLDVPTIGIYPMNWEYVSMKHFDGDSRHIVIPANRKDTAVECLRKHPGRTGKLKELCEKVIKNIHPDRVIHAIDNGNFL